jgi:hypothetical protein
MGVVPLAKAAAKGCCCAALAAKHDDVVAKSEVPIPWHEFDAEWGEPRKNPVVTNLLLDSTDACKFRGSCHGSSAFSDRLCKSGLGFTQCK